MKKVPSELKANIKSLLKILSQPKRIKHNLALERLRKIPRYTPTSIQLLGSEINLVDSASFLFMYDEIFEKEIYKFKVANQEPTIIDGGSNIGLSVLYFKQLYPQSKVIAFEPDPRVFSYLKKNIENLKLANIELVQKALWNSEEKLEFMSEGADGGRVNYLENNRNTIYVATVRLRDYLSQPIDFLKLDIEGAETEVIQDCRDLLHNVKNLFVEYHSFVSQPQTLHKIIDILSEAEFRIHIHPPMTSPQPFYYRNVHLGMDMQLNIFAFRE